MTAIVRALKAEKELCLQDIATFKNRRDSIKARKRKLWTMLAASSRGPNKILYHGIVEVMNMNIEQKSCLRALEFGQEVAIVEDCRCPFCADRVDEDEFRNEVFMKEFESSGLCQGCQDTVFGYKVAW